MQEMSFGARSTISPGRKSQVFSGAIFGLHEPFHSGGASPWKSYSIQPQWILSTGGQSYHLACYELQSRNRDEQGHWWVTPTDTNKLERKLQNGTFQHQQGSLRLQKMAPASVPEECPKRFLPLQHMLEDQQVHILQLCSLYFSIQHFCTDFQVM